METTFAKRLAVSIALLWASLAPISQAGLAQTNNPPEPEPDAASALLYLDPNRQNQLPLLAAKTARSAALGQNDCVSVTLAGTPSMHWNATALAVIRDAKPPPPVVARVLAVMHTAMYDAWSAYTPGALSTTSLDKMRRPLIEHTDANKRTAMYHAAHVALTDLFPAYRCVFDNSLVQAGILTGTLTTTSTVTPEGVGVTAARRLMTVRHLDRSNQLNNYADTSGYKPVNLPIMVTSTFVYSDANRWQPLITPSGSGQGGPCNPFGPGLTQQHVVPHFGYVEPFAMDDGPVITPTRGPARFPSAEFSAQATELITISAALNDKTKSIAEYWADGPASELPPGHWSLVAMFVSLRDANTLDEDARMFFAMTNATLDAGILSWKVKRLYDNSRPITGVRARFYNTNVRSWRGPELGIGVFPGRQWLPYQQVCFVSPPFAEFMSGHSTFSAAAAEVLKTFTGSDAFGATIVISQGTSLIEPDITPTQDVTLTWPTFSDAADEAGISRRYGGIHFREADLQARALGREVGRRAWARASFYFSNTITYSNSVLLPAVTVSIAAMEPVSTSGVITAELFVTE